MIGRLNIRRRIAVWPAASLVALAVAGVGPLPLAESSSPSFDVPPAPHPVLSLSKPIPHAQTPAEFRQALGVPLEDAGGGTHAVLERNAEAAKASLVAAGYRVNQMRMNYGSMSVDIVIARHAPRATDQAAARSSAQGAVLHFITVSRTTAQGEALQRRLDADRSALAERGIRINTTGIIEDGATVLVRLLKGTPEQADYLLRTYGPDGLTVSTVAGPIPREG